MAYGDYDGPEKPNKGHEGGACNRQLCQAEPARWYNHGSNSWYCDDCRQQIGEDVVNKRDWAANFFPKLGHPMFETREQIDARKANAAAPDGMIQNIVGPYFGWGSPGREKPQSASLQRLLGKKSRRV